MRIVFFGSGNFAIPTLRSITHDGHEVLCVVSQPDRPSGRGKAVTPTPLKREALDLGLPVVTPEDVNAADCVARLSALPAELGYVAAFGQKIGAPLRSAWSAGMVNLHASLLPRLRGAAPVQWAIINGLSQTGVTVFRLVEKMDAGPILVQRRTEIDPEETADELAARLSRIGCDAVNAALKLLEREPGAPGTPQDHGLATPAPKLKKSDGFIRFDEPAARIVCRVRGLWPWPGAMCRFTGADGRHDERVTIAQARPYDIRTRPAASPDETGLVNDMLRVQVADVELEVLQVKPSGGRLMSWQDFVNGRHVRAGDRFTTCAGPA